MKVVTKIIHKRINKNLIDDDALALLIEKSGGLVRDLIQFMQDACAIAIEAEKQTIDLEAAEQVFIDHANNYYRLFNFPKYEKIVAVIQKSNSKVATENPDLIHLLRHLFVLEYRDNGHLWYDLHPCLQEALTRK